MREYRYEWDVLYLKCSICWEWGTLDTHPKRKDKKFWVVAWCRKCNKQKRAKFYWNHREEQLNSNREYVRKNRKMLSEKARERCRNNREATNETVRNWRALHSDIIKERTKRYLNDKSEKLWFNWRSFHNKATLFVKKHWLRPNNCSICWKSWDVSMHHPYYDSFGNWSIVVFCCPACHSKIHIWEIECPSPVNLLDLIKL